MIPIVEEGVEIVGFVRSSRRYRRGRMRAAGVPLRGRGLIVPGRRVVFWDMVVVPFGRVWTERVEALPVDRL